MGLSHDDQMRRASAEMPETPSDPEGVMLTPALQNRTRVLTPRTLLLLAPRPNTRRRALQASGGAKAFNALARTVNRLNL